MGPREAMRLCQMTVFRPARRARYVMRWTDPASGQRRERTTGQVRSREAHQVAGEAAVRIVAGQRLDTDETTWAEFCASYEQLVISRRAGRALEGWSTVRRHVEADRDPPRKLAQITTAWVSRWQDRLLVGRSSNTVSTYLARLRAALRWAVGQEMLDRLPRFALHHDDTPRSRAITAEEFERLLAKITSIRPRDAAAWERLLRGQWLSGLRIAELLSLSWEPDAEVRLNATGRYPLIELAAEANKSRRRKVRPVLPEFWRLVAIPVEARQGHVFPIRGRRGQMTVKRVVRTISEIGQSSGVVTNPQTRKTATSHDLRRSFAVRMEARVSLAELQKWMGHASIDTTLTYYHTVDAEQLAAKLWDSDPESSSGPESGA